METRPLHLERDAIHLSNLGGVVPIPGFGHEYERYVAEHCSPEDPGRLVMIAESTEDWPSWEVHPSGDEVVIVLRGRAEFVQEIDGEERRVVVGPNEAIVNPAGVPHTANVLEPFAALYITPGPGTFHRPRSARAG